MDIDDLKNPEYRKGRRNPVNPNKAGPIRRPPLSEDERCARYAMQVARAVFGRFYWNDTLARRMERELDKARRRKREAAELASRRKHNGLRR